VHLRASLDDFNLDAQAGDLSAKLRLVVAQFVEDRAESVDREGQVVDLLGDLPKATEDAESNGYGCDDPLGHGVTPDVVSMRSLPHARLVQ
jgi:hypothetical protein